MTTPILAREGLSVGDIIEGPAIVEQFDTTTVIEPGDSAQVDEMGNLIIRVQLLAGGCELL
ncbi:MAG: hypothetical protein NT123_02225 [Proteobacteria bacterium]|nr:hypothetical protein [Pseudomonadota bacterium]